MTVIQVDAEMRERLGRIHGRVLLQDEHGEAIGYFDPVTRSDLDRAKQQFTDEEVDAARRSTERVTTTELLEYLGQHR